MIEITEELIEKSGGIREVLSEREVLIGPNTKCSLIVLIEVFCFRASPLTKSYCLDIYLEAYEAVKYGEDQCVDLVHVSTGKKVFKTTGRVKEVKEALTFLILEFNSEYFKTNHLITHETLKLRDDILLNCLTGD